MASAGKDGLTECREMSACARTYRVGANEYGVDAGWIATTGTQIKKIRATTGCARVRTAEIR